MSMKKRAFTLGEVLITLSVVGLLALLTVPSLVADISGKQRMVKLQNTIGDLNNAIQLYMMKNHLKSISDTDDFINSIAELMKVERTISSESKKYKTLTGTSVDWPECKGGARVLENGLYLCLHERTFEEKEYINAFMDINGDDPPNIAGIDVFEASIYKEDEDVDATSSLVRAGDISSVPAHLDDSNAEILHMCKSGVHASSGLLPAFCYEAAVRSGFKPGYYKEE